MVIKSNYEEHLGLNFSYLKNLCLRYPDTIDPLNHNISKGVLRDILLSDTFHRDKILVVDKYPTGINLSILNSMLEGVCAYPTNTKEQVSLYRQFTSQNLKDETILIRMEDLLDLYGKIVANPDKVVLDKATVSNYIAQKQTIKESYPNIFSDAEAQLMLDAELENGVVIKGILDILSNNFDGTYNITDFKNTKKPEYLDIAYRYDYVGQLSFYKKLAEYNKFKIRDCNLLFINDNHTELVTIHPDDLEARWNHRSVYDHPSINQMIEYARNGYFSTSPVKVNNLWQLKYRV